MSSWHWLALKTNTIELKEAVVTIPICAVTGRIAGDSDACGDCDPCGASHAVPEAVQRVLKEKDEWREKYGDAMAQNDATANQCAGGYRLDGTNPCVKCGAGPREVCPEFHRRLYSALQTSLVAMKLAAAMPAVAEEFDFTHAINEAERALACAQDKHE